MGFIKGHTCWSPILTLFVAVAIVITDNIFVSSQNILVDAVPKWLQIAGYPVEVHDVTSQGYIIQVHRIPRPRRPAVLLVHGILSSSIVYVFTGPRTALGYLLYDAGVDVWMANLRGSPCGMRHSFLKPTQRRFWDFSFHEHGVYDVTAITDYIVNITGNNKIHYVGYSMGGGSILVALSERPEYNDKFHQLILLAPSSYLKHIGGTVAQAAKYKDLVKSITDISGITHVPMGDNNKFLRQLYEFCKGTNGPLLCLPIVNTFLYGDNLRSHSLAIEFLRYYPETTSIKNLLHFAQMIGTDNFNQYDYGVSGNLRHYNSVTPPSYNLSRVTAPVTLFHSQNDDLVTPEDVELLKNKLPNLVKTFFIELPDFVHLSFILHNHVADLVYMDVVEQIREFQYVK